MNPLDPSRRRLFKAAGAGGLVAAIPLRLHAQPKPERAAYVFLSASEAAFIDLPWRDSSGSSATT
jgi:hypothetical protein